MKVFFGTLALAPGVTFDGESGAQDFQGSLQQQFDTSQPLRANYAIPIPRANWSGTVAFRADVLHDSPAAAELYVLKHLGNLVEQQTAGQYLRVTGEGSGSGDIYYRNAVIQSLAYISIGKRSIWSYTFAHGQIASTAS